MSQICSLICLPSIVIIRAPNSTPVTHKGHSETDLTIVSLVTRKRHSETDLTIVGIVHKYNHSNESCCLLLVAKQSNMTNNGFNWHEY